MKKKILCTLFFVSLFVSNCALADTITLKSGQKIEGKIIERTDKYVKVDFQGVFLTYYQEEISSISEGDKQSNSGADLGFNPVYTPIDFSGLSKHYPIKSELMKTDDEDYLSGDLVSEEALGNSGISPEALRKDFPKVQTEAPDLAAVMANFPPEYQEMIKSVQANPANQLSGLPEETRGLVEGILKNMPQSGTISAGEQKK